MKMLMTVTNVVMFIILNVGIKEIFVRSVKELKNDLKFKETLQSLVKILTKSN